MGDERDTIKGIAYHTLNFMVCDLMAWCFRLAFEKELDDLKGLVEPDSICGLADDDTPGTWDVELELLTTLDDKAVVLLMDSITCLIEARETYRIMNGLDIDEIVLDGQSIDGARNICCCADFIPGDDENYNRLVLLTEVMFTNFYYRLYVCAFMFMEGTVDVDEEEVQDELDKNHHLIMEESMVTGDHNVRLLLDLIKQLTGHCSLMDDYYDQLKT